MNEHPIIEFLRATVGMIVAAAVFYAVWLFFQPTNHHPSTPEPIAAASDDQLLNQARRGIQAARNGTYPDAAAVSSSDALPPSVPPSTFIGSEKQDFRCGKAETALHPNWDTDLVAMYCTAHRDLPENPDIQYEPAPAGISQTAMGACIEARVMEHPDATVVEDSRQCASLIAAQM